MASTVRVALAVGLPCGGWVPKGRTGEDGVIDARYPHLVEAPSADPAVRTALNVRDSDATVILSHGPLVGGTALTERLAIGLGRPLLVLDLDRLTSCDAAAALRDWLSERGPDTLNVAGARQSEDPRIHDAVKRVLGSALG